MGNTGFSTRESQIILIKWRSFRFLVSVRNYSNNRVDAGGRAGGRRGDHANFDSVNKI